MRTNIFIREREFSSIFKDLNFTFYQSMYLGCMQFTLIYISISLTRDGKIKLGPGIGSVSTLTHLHGQCMITFLETQVVSADDQESSAWLFTSFSDNTYDHGRKKGKWYHSEHLMDSEFENPSPPYRGPLRLSHNYSCSLLKRIACKT